MSVTQERAPKKIGAKLRALEAEIEGLNRIGGNAVSRSAERIRTGVLPVETWFPSASGDATFRYIDISSVDRHSKSIVGVTELQVRGAPSRARQILRADDVLVSTVRPNLNAVAIVPKDLDGAIGSTGFSVLRANPNRLLPRFLFYWVRSPAFLADMTKKATGASYPAVSDRIVLESSMPMPHVDEQRRIADILDKADVIRRKRKETITLTEELLRSAFLEMFGDPVTNPKGWPVKPLGVLGELDRGRSRHRPRNAPALLGGRHPLIQTGEVANCDGVIRSYKQTYSDLALPRARCGRPVLCALQSRQTSRGPEYWPSMHAFLTVSSALHQKRK